MIKQIYLYNFNPFDFVCLSVCLYLYVCLSVCLSICTVMSVCMYRYVCLSVLLLYRYTLVSVEWDLAQTVASLPVNRSFVGSILLSGPICSLGYYPFQPVVHNWFSKVRGMCCLVCETVHIKNPLLI